MENIHVRLPSYRRAAQACGALVLLISVAALLGWGTGNSVLLGIRARYIPMAPNTALAFIVMGASLCAAVGGSRGARAGAGMGALFTGLVSGLTLAEFLAGASFEVDRWFVSAPSGKVGLAPIGKMSLPTSIAFAAASVAVLTLAWPRRWPPLGHVTGSCGLATTIMGVVFVLGYLFSPNGPLLYGTETIPMALNTALCFVGLGAGIVAAAGPKAFPLLRLTGPSIRARLLRIFLPLVMGTVGVVAWLTHLISTTAGASSAVISSAALAAAAGILFGFICERVAGHVGGQIERAEDDLRLAHDLLEVKVRERTRALSRANGELAEALGDLQRAHQSLQQAHAELKQTQSQMLQQARMASLGQTAAGIAHEINNPLAFVTNNLAVLRREFSGLHDILLLYQKAEQTMLEYQRELYSRISELSEEVDLPFVLENLDGLLERSRVGLSRIQKIVADLRDFAHLEEADFKETNLNDGIAITVRLMQNLADARQVAIETDLAPLPAMTCYPARLNLVAQSLLTNAIEACPPGGRVVVQTRPVNGDIEIRVLDNGAGIDPSIRDQIFDPFFTTKPLGKGPGLGLAISYAIIKDHGGHIDFESSPGTGTQFWVRLPVSPPSGSLPELDGLGGSSQPMQVS